MSGYTHKPGWQYGRQMKFDEGYDLLEGPDGEFFCLLTEPEDRNFARDLRKIVERLNQQHTALADAHRLLREALPVLSEVTDEDGDPWDSVMLIVNRIQAHLAQHGGDDG